MNAETRIVGSISQFVDTEMSTDGEVLIPEDVRRAAGIVPGMRVVVALNDRGEVVVMTRTQAKRRGESQEQRSARLHAAFEDAGSGKYSTGQSTAEVMNELRGDRA